MLQKKKKKEVKHYTMIAFVFQTTYGHFNMECTIILDFTTTGKSRVEKEMLQ